MKYLSFGKKIGFVVTILGGFATFITFVMGGISTIFKQVWGYLETGGWNGFSANEIIMRFKFSPDKLADWAYHPSSMHGLHDIFNIINGGVFMIAIGSFILFFLYHWIDSIVNEADRLEEMYKGKD